MASRLLAILLLAATTAAQHPAGVVDISQPCYGNNASVPNSPHVGATGGVWLTMDRPPAPGRPIGWRLENEFFFAMRGRWLIAIDFGRAWPFRMPSPASECWLSVPLRYAYWPKTYGMGTVWVSSPWRLPWSASGLTFYCTAVGWNAEGGRFSHVWASNTIGVVVP